MGRWKKNPKDLITGSYLLRRERREKNHLVVRTTGRPWKVQVKKKETRITERTGVLSGFEGKGGVITKTKKTTTGTALRGRNKNKTKREEKGVVLVTGWGGGKGKNRWTGKRTPNQNRQTKTSKGASNGQKACVTPGENPQEAAENGKKNS